MHHIVPRGNGRYRIVLDDRDRNAYTGRFVRVARELGWSICASCLMDTHHHAVVETPEANLGVGLRRILGGHARWFNLKHGREGSLFEPHCWSRRVWDDAHLFRACLYVVLNPVAAGLCRHPREWKWCSFEATAYGAAAYAPGEKRLLEMFGDSPAEARRAYARVVDELAELVAHRPIANAGEVMRSIDELAVGGKAGVRLKSDTGEPCTR